MSTLGKMYDEWRLATNTHSLRKFLNQKGHLLSIKELSEDNAIWSDWGQNEIKKYIIYRKDELMKEWTKD